LTCNVSHDLEIEEFDARLSTITTLKNQIGLIGLHTCGDLGPTIVRLFAQSTHIQSIQSVGCCYMHIKHCFPMSTILKNAISNYSQFTYTCLELACHAIETYKDRLKTSSELTKLKVHCKRALLEDLLSKKKTELKHCSLKTVKRPHEMDFQEYVHKATSGIEGLEWTTEELESEEISTKEGQWMEVVAFYTLRLLFAPLIETVLLLDRCMYLSEHGHNCTIAPIFDPRISPRNFVILACKENKSKQN